MCAFLAAVMLILGCASSSQAPLADSSVNESAELDGPSEPAVDFSIAAPTEIGASQAPAVASAGTSSIKLQMPTSGATGYTFTAVPTNVRATAEYSWYVTWGGVEYEVVSAEVGRRKVKFTNNSLTSADSPYTITVLAKWIDDNNREQSVQDSVIFCMPWESTITLQIPSGAPGPDAEYMFAAVPDNVPDGALYTWSVGQTRERSDNSPAPYISKRGDFYAGYEYIITIEAEWKDDCGQTYSVKDSGKFSVSQQTRPQPPPPPPPAGVRGERITCPCCGAEREYFAHEIHYLVNWGRDSVYCKDCRQRFCVHSTAACYGCNGPYGDNP
jgi:hypothetical protein